MEKQGLVSMERVITGDFDEDYKKLCNFDLRWGNIENGKEKLNNEDLLLFFDQIIPLYNDFIILYMDKMSDAGFEIMSLRKAKYYDLRGGVEEIDNEIKLNLSRIHALNVFKTNK